MAKAYISPENQRFIIDNRLTVAPCDLSSATGLSTQVIRSFLKRQGLSVPREASIKLRTERMKGRTTFTPEQTQFIIDNYLEIPVKRLAEAIGKSYCGVMIRMRQLGLEIPREIVERRKAESRIQPGTPSHNKGRPMTEWMSPEKIERTKATRFKKGQIPHNAYDRDGVVRVRRDKSGKQYKYIRIALGVWRMEHVVNWEKQNGRVPAGHVITFKDGDSLNTDISNLEMISCKENMLRNTIHRYPAEFKKAMRLSGVITRQINKHSKPK
jgi:hypothetical protein